MVLFILSRLFWRWDYPPSATQQGPLTIVRPSPGCGQCHWRLPGVNYQPKVHLRQGRAQLRPGGQLGMGNQGACLVRAGRPRSRGWPGRRCVAEGCGVCASGLLHPSHYARTVPLLVRPLSGQCRACAPAAHFEPPGQTLEAIRPEEPLCYASPVRQGSGWFT